jgi:hypothetical protein
MSWSNATDIDFHVWDVNGRHSFYRNLTAIPASVVSQDILVGSEWKSSLKVTTRADSLPYLVHPPRTHAIAPVRQIGLTHSSSARSWVTDALSTTGATEYAVRLSSTETAKPSRMSARSPNLNTEAVMSLRGSRAVPRFTSVLSDGNRNSVHDHLRIWSSLPALARQLESACHPRRTSWESSLAGAMRR